MTTDLSMLAWTAGLTLVLAFPYVLATIQQYGVMDALIPVSGWFDSLLDFPNQPISDSVVRTREVHHVITY